MKESFDREDTMKEVYRNDDVIAYDGFKDAFGKKIFVVIHDTLNELRLYSKYPDYQKRRNALDRTKLSHVWTPEYGIVIDVSEVTKKRIEKLFPGYKHSEWQIVG